MCGPCLEELLKAGFLLVAKDVGRQRDDGGEKRWKPLLSETQY